MILSGKVVIAAGVAGAMLVAALGWQTYRLHTETVGRATAQSDLKTCRGLNSEHKAQIDEINAQAERDLSEAQRRAMLAENARRAAVAHSARVASELAAERGMLASIPADDCLDRPAPSDIDRMFRAGPDGAHRDRDQDGGSLCANPLRANGTPGRTGYTGGADDLAADCRPGAAVASDGR